MLNFTFEGLIKPLLDSAIVNNIINSSEVRDKLFGSIICVVSIVMAIYYWRAGYSEDFVMVPQSFVQQVDDAARSNLLLSDAQLQTIAMNLFDNAGGENNDNQVDNLPPETALNLFLSAVFYSDDPKQAAAAIDIGANATKILQAGEEIMSNVLLKSVGTNSVIIERNGKLESLKLGYGDKKVNASELSHSKSTSKSFSSQTSSALLDLYRAKQNTLNQDNKIPDAIQKRLDKLRKGSQ